MLGKSTRYGGEPVEDVAISSLLEIDLREQQEPNFWEEQHVANRVVPKRRTYSFHKHPKAPLHPPHSKQYHQPQDSSRSNYHLALLKELSHDSAAANAQEEQESSHLLAKSTQFNQGEYWSSRVNWMSEEHIKGHHRSQPKLNKKFSFGYEVNGRKTGRNCGKNGQDEKTRHNEYKTNLIYSLLAHKDAFKGRDERGGAQANSCGKTASRRTSMPIREERDCKLSTQVQQYMRETLKKLYMKNRIEDHPGAASAVKQSEQSSMIRELLINIQNIKDYQNSTQACSGQATINCSKQNGKDHIEEIVQTRTPQRKLHYLHHPNKHVLDLNQEVEKTYHGRSIHQGTLRAPPIIKHA